MLQILLGRAGAGKTTELLRRMAVSGTQRRQLLLVPEQASHEMERRLCQEAGNRSALYAEVLSFTRLGNRVLSQTGGLAGPVLDPGGRILLMYAAVKAVSASLTVFARPSRRPAFLSGHLSTLDDQGRQEEFWLGQAAAGLDTAIAELAGQFESVTREQVAEIARRMELDTIYFLKGKGA